MAATARPSATQRRARLRRFARHRSISKALVLLLDLITAASRADTRFSRFLSAALSGCVNGEFGGSRDVLPLPMACNSWLRLPCATIAHCARQLRDLTNATVTGVNYLYANLRPAMSSRTPRSVQRLILARFAERWWRLALHLNSNPGGWAGTDAFAALVSKHGCPPVVPLKAARVDLPEACAKVNPQPFLPTDVVEKIHRPHLLFPHGVAHISDAPVFRGGARAEYVMLLRRQVRAGKIRFLSAIIHGAPVFTVQKGETDRQREIWNGGPLSESTLPPPSMPYLANPAALASLESSDDIPIWVSTRDGVAFFDQLRSPAEITPFTGRPAVTVAELCDTCFRGDHESNQYPLDRTELRAHCDSECGALAMFDVLADGPLLVGFHRATYNDWDMFACRCFRGTVSLRRVTFTVASRADIGRRNRRHQLVRARPPARRASRKILVAKVGYCLE